MRHIVLQERTLVWKRLPFINLIKAFGRINRNELWEKCLTDFTHGMQHLCCKGTSDSSGYNFPKFLRTFLPQTVYCLLWAPSLLIVCRFLGVILLTVVWDICNFALVPAMAFMVLRT